MSAEKKSFEKEHFLFASYSRANREVPLILRFLKDKGYNIWYDKNIVISENWRNSLYERIRESAGVLIFVSREFMESKNCKDEMTLCYYMQKENIIPINLEARLDYTPEMTWLKEYNIKEYADIDTLLDDLNDLSETVPEIKACRKDNTDTQKDNTDTQSEPSESQFILTPADEKNSIDVERCITPTEEKYKILMLGSEIPAEPGSRILVECGNTNRLVRFHSTTKGRIDGLSDFYRDAGLKKGMKIRARYTPKPDEFQSDDGFVPLLKIEILEP